jgi:hypothetical protein
MHYHSGETAATRAMIARHCGKNEERNFFEKTKIKKKNQKITNYSHNVQKGPVSWLG